MLKESNNDIFYVFTSHPSAWDNESSPPAVDLSVYQSDNEIFRNIVYGKRITDSDSIAVIRRIDWTANTVYVPYDMSTITDTSNTQFYVLTSEKKVFKCIDNNKGVPSTIEPFLDSRRTFKTSDGYSWRYLYTISDADFAKFATASYIPVTPNSTIVSVAIPGTIDHIAVTNVGTGYTAYNSGNVVAILNNTNVTIEPTASANNNYYVNNAIYFKGDMVSELSTITAYDGTTKTVTVDPPLTLQIDVILSNSGSGSFTSNLVVRQEYFEVVTSNTSGSSLSPDTTIQQRSAAGANQTYVVIDTTDAGFRLHRSNSSDTISLTEPWRATSGELGRSGKATTSVGSNVVTGTSGSVFTSEYSVGEYIRVGVETRQIASIASASSMTTYQTWATAYSANDHVKPARAGFFSTATQKTANGIINSVDVTAATIYLSTIDGTFQAGETLTQSNSSGTIASGLVIDSNSSTIFVGNVVGSFTFSSNLTVVGANSGATGIPKTTNGVVVNPRLLITNAQGSWYTANVSAFNTSNIEVANGKVSTYSSFPGIGTQYIISPKVVIEGDGEGAAAYSVINTITSTVDSIVVTNPGNNYTYANVTLESNSVYGTSATARALLSPVEGVGANVANELNSKHTCISVQFQNTVNEGYYFSTNTSFRQIGIIKNPQFRDLFLTIGTLQHAKMNTSSTTGTFAIDEIVLQPSSNAAGVVVFANSTFIEIEKVNGTFTANAAGDNILGLTSGATANVRTYSKTSYSINTAITQTLYQDATEAQAKLTFANSTVLGVTNTFGVFTNTSVTTNTSIAQGSRGYVYDPTNNAYATVANVGNYRKPTNFDQSKFNQVMRVAIDSLTGSFANNERVYQGNTSGYILNSTNDFDLAITGVTGTFALGDTVQQATSNATATVIAANSTYLKLTSANGTFTSGLAVSAVGGSGASATGIIAYKVLNLYGTDDDFALTNETVIGETSNARATTVSGVSYAPDLVRNTGEVLYIQNSTAVTKTAASQEQIKIVVQYL